jgi:subtilisin family serine protease
MRFTLAVGAACVVAWAAAPCVSSAAMETPTARGRAEVGYRSPADLRAALRSTGARLVRRIPALHVAEVELQRSSAAALARRHGIRYVDGLAARESAVEPALAAPLGRSLPFEWQYSAAREDLVPQWVLRAASSVTIAVIDTGADLTAPDLAAKTIAGYDVRTGASDVADANGHGTFVASLAGGSVANDEGMAGFGGDAKLLVIRAGRPDGAFTDVDEASGIVYAIQHGARIINLSVGGPGTSPTERRAIDFAVSHGALVVAAAGNEFQSGNPVEYPAALLQPLGSRGNGGGGLSVGASDAAGTRAHFSNTGTYLSLAAPGENVFGALSSLSSPIMYPRVPLAGSRAGLYGFASGTSFAAPEVSGAAALVWAANPTLTAPQVAEILKETASGLGNWTPELGYGVIDVAAAVARAAGGTTQSVLLSGIRIADRVRLTWTGPSGNSFRVRLTREDGLDRILLASTDRTEASFRLGVGHTYTFTVTALDANGTPTASSATFTVRVERAHAAVALAASHTVGRGPLHLALTAALRSGAPEVPAGSRRLVLEFFDGSSWRHAGTATTGPDGRATWTLTLHRGTYRVRAAYAGGPDLGRAVSPAVSVRVR